MSYLPPRPAPRAPALAAGPLPRVVVVAGSTAGAGTSTTAAVLAASVAALGRAVHLSDATDAAAAAAAAAAADAADAPHDAPDALHVLDAGARLDAVRGALARNPGAVLLVVTGTLAPALAAAFALAKATSPNAAEVIVVGGDPAEAAAAFARLDEGARHFLGRPLRLAAVVPDDPSLAVALSAGMPVHDAAAGSPAAAALHALAERAARPNAAGGASAVAPRSPAWASPRSAPAPAFAR